jgi:hypothetical protein
LPGGLAAPQLPLAGPCQHLAAVLAGEPAGQAGVCETMAFSCGQADRHAAFPGPRGPGRLPGLAQRFLPAALIGAVVTQRVGAGTVFHGSGGLAAFT